MVIVPKAVVVDFSLTNEEETHLDGVEKNGEDAHQSEKQMEEENASAFVFDAQFDGESLTL